MEEVHMNALIMENLEKMNQVGVLGEYRSD